MTWGELIDVLKSNVEASIDGGDSVVPYQRQDIVHRTNSQSESGSNATANSSQGIAGSPLVNFHIMIEEKLPVHGRKRYEKQVTRCNFFLETYV